ncbi:MAG TPA: hypothetical protein VLH41_00795, partial [Thermoanaerobaculia bacterium]|nr:hypothetical protein [Thermoanaerobaculia bacterium]
MNLEASTLRNGASARRASRRAISDLERLLLPHHLDRDLRQVANDRLHVAADVAHFGELGGLDL